MIEIAAVPGHLPIVQHDEPCLGQAVEVPRRLPLPLRTDSPRVERLRPLEVRTMNASATPDAATLPQAGPRYTWVSRYAMSIVIKVSPTATGHVCLIRSARRRFRTSNSACAELPAADGTRSATDSGETSAIAIVPRHCGNVEHPQNRCPTFGPRPAVRSTISDEHRGHVRAAAVK